MSDKDGGIPDDHVLLASLIFAVMAFMSCVVVVCLQPTSPRNPPLEMLKNEQINERINLQSPKKMPGPHQLNRYQTTVERTFNRYNSLYVPTQPISAYSSPGHLHQSNPMFYPSPGRMGAPGRPSNLARENTAPAPESPNQIRYERSLSQPRSPFFPPQHLQRT